MQNGGGFGSFRRKKAEKSEERELCGSDKMWKPNGNAKKKEKETRRPYQAV